MELVILLLTYLIFVLLRAIVTRHLSWILLLLCLLGLLFLLFCLRLLL